MTVITTLQVTAAITEVTPPTMTAAMITVMMMAVTTTVMTAVITMTAVTTTAMTTVIMTTAVTMIAITTNLHFIAEQCQSNPNYNQAKKKEFFQNENIFHFKA